MAINSGKDMSDFVKKHFVLKIYERTPEAKLAGSGSPEFHLVY